MNPTLENVASGYEPNSISLTFGHGPASYLNIVKNSETLITCGPHSTYF